MIKKTPALFSLLAILATFFLSGCYTNHPASPDEHVKVLGGLYEYRQAAYARPAFVTMPVRMYELNPGAPLTGDSRTFLWGAFTVYDH